jgi:microcin C transport system permease protein
MKAYFIRRLLLVPITMLGVTLLVFTVTRIVPGGPLERKMQQASAAAAEGGGGGGSANPRQQGGLSEEAIEELEEEYGYDKTIPMAYLQWVGVIPRERLVSKGEFRKGGEEAVGGDLIKDPNRETLVDLKGSGLQAKIVRKAVEPERPAAPKKPEKPSPDQLEAYEQEVKTHQAAMIEWRARMNETEAERREVVSAVYASGDKAISEGRWIVRIELPEDRRKRWAKRNKKEISMAPENYDARAVIFKRRFSGVLQLDLNRSTEFGDPVISLILGRIPVALYFGILSTIIIYSVCLPLGMVKAIAHRTALDNLSSVLIFVGYAIPGFALGAVLLVYLGARLQWFPMMGLESPDFDSMDTWGKIKDRASHTVLPLICYVIGGFAWLTMMMKNNLMDNLAADYVRTAVAKGVSFRRAVFRHAFRNSFIPIASTLGHLITMFVVGSLLIESVFDIQGFGLLSYQSLLGRDQFLIMGTLTISAFLMIIGNILSDVIVAFVDPRIKYH